MIYCDTSVFVAALVPEVASERVLQWQAEQPSGTLCLSAWTKTELSSALSIKVRSGSLSLEERAEVLTRWRLLLSENLTQLPLPGDAFELAASFADNHELGLRGGDALHVAIAAMGGYRLATLDKTMAAASLEVGVSVVEIG
jgi:predicted nucleic acid-binding protein